MLSVSYMSFIAGADLCYAGFNPYDTPPVLNAAMLKSHVSTHTSHLTAAHLSSLEDFAELTLPENSGLSLPKTLRSSLSYPLPKDLGRGWGGFHNTALIQLAAACFVTDTTNCSGNEFANADSDDNDGGVPPGGDDYELDNDKRCIEEGYTLTSCPEGYEPYNYCPYDRTYFEKCVSSCPSDYVTCEEPYYGVGEACDGKYASCECTPCSSGYDDTSIPEGYVQDGEACLDCDGKTKYKIKPNPCDGFMDCGSMGGEAGAKTCLSGTITMYDNCKPCPNLGTLTSCPAPFTCTYEECSGLWYKTGCQSGYDWNESTKTCTAQCSEDYKYTCTGSHETSGSGEACNGLYQSCECDDWDYGWDGSVCRQASCNINDCMKGNEHGYILYSDMTRSKNLIEGKTPIGVVICSYADGSGEAIALEQISISNWGDGTTHYASDRRSDVLASEDLDSCKHTKDLITLGDKDKFPAAWAAHEYKTEGTETGNWCLPAAGVLASFFYKSSEIDSGYKLIKGQELLREAIISSTEGSHQSSVWLKGSYKAYYHSGYGMDNHCGLATTSKKSVNIIRPVIPFCQEGYSYDYDTNTCKKAERAEWGKCNGYAKNCNIGDILYSDGTCSVQRISGKTPIAVVVYKSSDGNCAQAMALKPIGTNEWDSNGYGTDISSLSNYSLASDAAQDFASCENTAVITADGTNGSCPAAWESYVYTTEGTNVGDWCLPAAGIFNSIKNNFSTINAGIMLANGEQLYVNDNIWSSSEYDSYTVWFLRFSYSYGLWYQDKSEWHDIRPVLEF